VSDISGALGMCVRAGACSFGFDSALKMLRKNKSRLVIVDEDASEKTKKRITDKCVHYNTEIMFTGLSKTLDKLKIQGNIKIISINDINFKKLIDKRLKEKHKHI